MAMLWMLTFGSTISMLMVALRQSYSICFVLLSILLIEKASQQCTEKRELLYLRPFWGGVICFIFAMTIHRTSIIFLPLLIIIYFVHVNKRMAFWLLSLAFIISLIFSNYISDMFDMAMVLVGGIEDDKISLLADRYGSEMENSGASLVSKLALCIPIYLVTYFTDEDNINTFKFKCLLFSIILFLFFSSSTVIIRIILLFLVLGYSVVIPSDVVDDDNNKRIYILYLLFTVYYLWRAFVHFAADLESLNNTYILYKFVWE